MQVRASAVPSLLPGIVLLLSALASAACEKSGTIAGGYVPPDASTGPVACVFDELDTFTCPGISLAPPLWTGKCVDADDCGKRVSGTTTTAGCEQATKYRNVQEVSMSCGAWEEEGGLLPVVDSGSPPVCAPGAVTGFAPKWHPPRAHTTACTKVQIDAYLQCLNDAATTPSPASCAEWSGALSASDQACLTCLSSNESDATYGPLVLLPTEELINVAGCIALAEGKTDGSGCGGALQADEQCQRAACFPICVMTSPSERSAEQECEAQANKLPDDAGAGGACAAFVPPAECAGAIQLHDAGTAAERQCLGGDAGAGDTQFEAVALAFCGP
jgi:hypothetical protein